MKSKEDTIKAYYDYTRRFYRVFYHRETQALHYGFWDSTTKNLREALLNMNRILAERASIQPGEKILDAGCGVGGSAFWLARHKGVRVMGITLSKGQLAKARELSQQLHFEQETEFYLKDYTQTGFPDNSFDVVWAIESVCHAFNKSAFLNEAYRLLKSGGRLIIADGFLARAPETDREKSALRNFLKGLALDNLAEPRQFLEAMKIAGFKNSQSWDESLSVLPTSKILRRMCLWGWPLSVVTMRLGLTPRLLTDNNRAGIDQYFLLKKGILTYNIFLAEK